MAQRTPLVIGSDGLPQQVQPGDAIPLPAFGASGAIANCKLWIGEATTDANGAWSVDFTGAGFTAPPKVQPQAISASTAAASAAQATVTARSTTAASGYVNLPAVVVLGGLSITRAASGLTVMVVAVGP